MTLPDFIEQVIARKWLGDKTKQGFYKKERGADGKEVRSVLNLETFEYQPASKPSSPTSFVGRSVTDEPTSPWWMASEATP